MGSNGIHDLVVQRGKEAKITLCFGTASSLTVTFILREAVILIKKYLL